MRNQDQGWGYQGPVISGSQAPLGTQGTSEVSGISLNQDQGGGYQVLALISLIQHSADNGACWPLLPVPSTSAAAATARCCCMTMVGAPRVCVAQHRRRQHGPPRPAPAPRRAWPPGIPDSGNRESRFGRDRENKPRCPGIGDFGVWSVVDASYSAKVRFRDLLSRDSVLCKRTPELHGPMSEVMHKPDVATLYVSIVPSVESH
jgi:hypothetical protein